ncbi:MAG: Verru_Chthon cassette protein C [Verrucomicrobiaceae bacterium]|nr:Verru_Chthon cassette protein C [Verrucomicrobiaceae bacterium]
MSYHKTNLALTRHHRKGFTLVELMVSVAILVILMLVVSNFIGLVQRTWVRANSNTSQFREARLAFDILTKNIGQATLNTYWQADTDISGDAGLGTVIYSADNFKRQSELQFVCGPSVGGAGAIFAAGAATTYPGHAVFFQAPLGITSLVATPENDTTANTQGMVNLLCGRGYWVEWGTDSFFRPAFLAQKNVPVRSRFRLMEYSPTAEQNRIYDEALRPITENSKQWFLSTDPDGGDAREQGVETEGETVATRAFTRPVAENILTLIISPQTHSIGAGTTPTTAIAPSYAYDSTAIVGPTAANPQGAQHLLPPLLKVTMVALDARGGETLSIPNNPIRDKLTDGMANLFTTATSYEDDLNNTLIPLLNENKIAYRVFTTTIALKQARWSK